MTRWEVAVIVGLYTGAVFVVGAFFGRWLWIRISEKPHDAERESLRRCVEWAARITERHEL